MTLFVNSVFIDKVSEGFFRISGSEMVIYKNKNLSTIVCLINILVTGLGPDRETEVGPETPCLTLSPVIVSLILHYTILASKILITAPARLTGYIYNFGHSHCNIRQ